MVSDQGLWQKVRSESLAWRTPRLREEDELTGTRRKSANKNNLTWGEGMKGVSRARKERAGKERSGREDDTGH